MSRRRLILPLNRVEGDLEINVEIVNHRVMQAQVSGTMFRGFEQMMRGRGLLDGLVITPRICGICSTSHLYAAALALDDLQQAEVPDNAVRMRNLTHIAEHLQSDLRHAILMFAVDFAHPSYAQHGFFDEAQRCYAPLQGESALSTIKATQKILEIVAIIGGQWPHSSFMVPGGIVSTPNSADLRSCRLLLEEFRRWYETRILGGSLVEWQQVRSYSDLEAWCQLPAQSQGDLARILRIGRELQLDRGTASHGFISGGGLPLPAGEARAGQSHLSPSGHWQNGILSPLDLNQISEDLACSYYQSQGPTESLFQMSTRPDADKKTAYSWVKAPRYKDQPNETGPLAELLCQAHPLMCDWVAARGISPLARELARLLRPADLIKAGLRWVRETDPQQRFYIEPEGENKEQGRGIVQASRGMLIHWLEARDEVISHYRMITPTSWNASPRDQKGYAGPIEQALLGAEVSNQENPLELGHIVRSFDPCLVCAVHSLHSRGRNTLRLGAWP